MKVPLTRFSIQCALHECRGSESIRIAKKGGTFALYDPAAKRACQLDNQKKARDFSGRKVTIPGNP
jgi:hypothetical protein